MTKKDYQRIASMFQHTDPKDKDVLRPDIMRHQWLMDVEHMAGLLAQDNPRFDRARFLKACGIED